MNREEVLARSRKEGIGKEDEREYQLLLEASKLGMAVGGILAACIVLFARIVDLPVLGLAAWSVYFAMFGSRRLYQHFKTKEKTRLLQGVVGVVFALACLVTMVVLGLKK